MAQYEIKVLNNGFKTVLIAEEGVILADLLSENGFNVTAACGRRGICGKCKVRLVGGAFFGENADENGDIKSCRASVCQNAEIEVNSSKTNVLTSVGSIPSVKGTCGAAVDIGTTTVAVSVIKEDGSVVSASALNPQAAYGADVLSRIKACSDGYLETLSGKIRNCINELLIKLCPDREPDEVVISGNTTMLHIFCGVSPESIGVSPFLPRFTDAVFLGGADCGLNSKKVTVLPSVSAFIGSDVVAGIFATEIYKKNAKTSILADLGTNGEIVLSVNGKLFCTSAAAGPALEGACIECGTGGTDGAVDSVYLNDDGSVSFTTVNGKQPNGICGAGLVDAVSVLLDKGEVDENGYFGNEKFDVTDSVFVSQKDIRQFQLAKSAVCSAVEILAEYAGIPLDRVNELLIAGGLGYYIKPKNALRTGLLPPVDINTVKSAGNTSLQGALMCIGNSDAVKKMREIASKCTVIDLGGNAAFNEKFIDNMYFNV